MKTTQCLNPQIGLGTFSFSNVFSPVTQTEAAGILAAFMEMGGHYIETAPSYPVNAVKLGDILKDLGRDRFFLATKCVVGVDADGHKITSGKKEFIRRQCEEELKRLGVSHLDLLQTHVLPDDTPVAETIQCMEELRREGIVRFIGVSNATEVQLIECLKYGRMDFVQNRLSLLHRESLGDIREFCAKVGAILNPYQILERGLLTDNPTAAKGWSSNDLRAKKPEYNGQPLEVIRYWLDTELQSIARTAGLSLEEIAIRWIFSQVPSAVPVLGATSVQQVRRNMRTRAVPLSAELLEQVEKAFARLKAKVSKDYSLSIEKFRGLSSWR
jgi:aryl-alcohol dehydrogenase-like predicted oxidoreductase